MKKETIKIHSTAPVAILGLALVVACASDGNTDTSRGTTDAGGSFGAAVGSGGSGTTGTGGKAGARSGASGNASSSGGDGAAGERGGTGAGGTSAGGGEAVPAGLGGKPTTAFGSGGLALGSGSGGHIGGTGEDGGAGSPGAGAATVAGAGVGGSGAVAGSPSVGGAGMGGTSGSCPPDPNCMDLKPLSECEAELAACNGGQAGVGGGGMGGSPATQQCTYNGRCADGGSYLWSCPQGPDACISANLSGCSAMSSTSYCCASSVQCDLPKPCCSFIAMSATLCPGVGTSYESPIYAWSCTNGPSPDIGSDCTCSGSTCSTGTGTWCCSETAPDIGSNQCQ